MEGKYGQMWPIPCKMKGEHVHMQEISCKMEGKHVQMWPIPCKMEGGHAHMQEISCKMEGKYVQILPNTMQNNKFKVQIVTNTRQILPAKKSKKKSQTCSKKT
jgi:hypothetical protein